jgi:hypothetical protein
LEHIKARLPIEEGRLLEHKAPPVDEFFFENLPAKMKDPDYCLKLKEVLGQMIKEVQLCTHFDHMYYQIERTNGNFWSVVFEETKRQRRAFQIFRGRAFVPYDKGSDEYPCELVGRSNGKQLLALQKPVGTGTS